MSAPKAVSCIHTGLPTAARAERAVRKRPCATPSDDSNPGIGAFEKARKSLDFSTCGRGRSSPHVSEKERAEGGFQGDFVLESAHLVHIFAEVRIPQDTPRDGTTRGKTPPRGSASKRRETVPPGDDGGGGGNRTHVRRTVPTGRYERSLRFSFAGRMPTGRLTTRLVRSFSPHPYEPQGSGKLDVLTPKPTLPAPSGGRRRDLGGECQAVGTVGSYWGARFDEITRLGSQPVVSRPPSNPFAPLCQYAAISIVPGRGRTGQRTSRAGLCWRSDKALSSSRRASRSAMALRLSHWRRPRASASSILAYPRWR